MPGIVGCVTHKFELEENVISRMAEPALHRSAYRMSEHQERKFAVAAIDLAQNRQNGRAKNEKYILSFFGSIYESWAAGSDRIAEQLLERFISGGWKQIADLNGEYLIVVWDRAEEKLSIVNDRLGLRKLNYWQGNGTFAFATELKSLAVLEGVSLETDEHALAELLTMGHLQDNRTLLRDIALFPPASYLTWQNGTLNIHQYWDYVYKEDAKLRNHQTAVEEYFQHTWNAVERRLEGIKKVGLFLSGGLDSRTLAGFIRKMRPHDEFFTWTAGHGHDHDTRYAEKIAKAVKSKHVSLNISESFLNLYGPEYSWVLDGVVSTHGSHRKCLIDEAVGKVDLVMLGYMGDTVSGGKPLDHVYQFTDIEDISQNGYASYAVGFDQELMKKVFKPKIYEQNWELAYESFRKSVNKAKVEFPGDRVVYAELLQRQRLYNPPAQMDLQTIDLPWSTPFADKDFIDFALRLPWGERLHKEAYIGMLCKHFPELARIPRSGDGLPLRPSRLHSSLHWRWVLFQRNTLPKLTGGLLGGHNYGAFVHCSDWFRKSSAQLIRSKLINNPILEDKFKMNELNQLVESFLNDTAGRDLMECIAALMSYVLFRERLLKLPKHSIVNKKEAVNT